MGKYRVHLPVTGYIMVDVDADSEDEAKSKAYEEADYNITGSDNTEPGEFDTHFCVCEGNVFHGTLNRYEVEEVLE